MTVSRLPRVYMAGKIASGDWRHGLVGRQLRSTELHYDDRTHSVQPDAAPVFDGFEYAGPFFLGDDHSCFHGPHSHGFGALKWPACEPSNVHHDDMGWALSANADGISSYWQTRKLVQQSCFQWIRSADALFAWVEQWDAYATLLEIGYAAARGIPIFIAFNLLYQPGAVEDAPTSVWNDWWFAEQTATWAEYDADPRAAWASFTHRWEQQQWTPPERKRRLWFVAEAP